MREISQLKAGRRGGPTGSKCLNSRARGSLLKLLITLSVAEKALSASLIVAEQRFVNSGGAGFFRKRRAADKMGLHML